MKRPKETKNIGSVVPTEQELDAGAQAPRKKLNLKKWKGVAKNSFAELGYKSVDEFIEDIRGR